MTRAQGRDGAVVLGLVAPSGVARELAEQIAAELPGELRGRLGDVNWQVRVGGAERADTTPTTAALKQSVRRRMQDEGWDLAVGLTDVREAAYRHHADERTERDEDGPLGTARRIARDDCASRRRPGRRCADDAGPPSASTRRPWPPASRAG
jgi:hypothetical protein